MSHPLSLLKDRWFARFWGAGAISNIGSFMQSAVLAVMVAKETGKASLSGLIMVTTFLPQFIAAPLGGVLADRYDRRKLFFSSMVISTLATGVLGLLVAGGERRVPVLTAVLLVQGFVVAAGDPSATSIIAGLIGPAKMPLASVLMTISWNSGRVFGPPIGIAIARWTSPATVILANAVTFGFVAFNLWLLRVRAFRPPPRPASSAWRELADAASFMRADATCRFAVGHLALMQLFLAPFMGVVPIWTLRRFGSAELAGSFFLAQGVGALLGALVVSWFNAWWGRSRAFFVFSLVSAAGLLLYSFAPVPAVGMVAIFVVGSAVPMCFTSLIGMVHRDAPETLRGRITALMFAAIGGTYTVGVLSVGRLGDLWSLQRVFLAGGAVFVAATLLSRWRISTWPVLDAPIRPAAVAVH